MSETKPVEESAPVDPKVAARAAVIWPGIVVALLVFQIIISGVAVVLASKDGGPVVVEDYHQRSLDWDNHRAELNASAQLGWRAVWMIEPESDAIGQRQLRVDIIDADRQPIVGADVSAVVFHHAHANQRQTLKLEEATPGCYVVKFPARWSGIWELELEAKRESNRFLLNENKEIRFPATNQPKVLPR